MSSTQTLHATVNKVKHSSLCSRGHSRNRSQSLCFKHRCNKYITQYYPHTLESGCVAGSEAFSRSNSKSQWLFRNELAIHKSRNILHVTCCTGLSLQTVLHTKRAGQRVMPVVGRLSCRRTPTTTLLVNESAARRHSICSVSMMHQCFSSRRLHFCFYQSPKPTRILRRR